MAATTRGDEPSTGRAAGAEVIRLTQPSERLQAQLFAKMLRREIAAMKRNVTNAESEWQRRCELLAGLATAAVSRRSGRFHAMRTTIDPAGRLVIPKRIRDRLGLRGNDQVEITERAGRIEIEPAPTEVELVREGSVLVARPDRALPPLTDEVVRETLDRARR